MASYGMLAPLQGCYLAMLSAVLVAFLKSYDSQLTLASRWTVTRNREISCQFYGLCDMSITRGLF